MQYRVRQSESDQSTWSNVVINGHVGDRELQAAYFPDGTVRGTGLNGERHSFDPPRLHVRLIVSGP